MWYREIQPRQGVDSSLWTLLLCTRLVIGLKRVEQLIRRSCRLHGRLLAVHHDANVPTCNDWLCPQVEAELKAVEAKAKELGAASEAALAEYSELKGRIMQQVRSAGPLMSSGA